jgi:hypothetical protein
MANFARSKAPVAERNLPCSAEAPSEAEGEVEGAFISPGRKSGMAQQRWNKSRRDGAPLLTTPKSMTAIALISTIAR